MWIPLAVYFVSQEAQLGLVEIYVNVYITALCSFVNGFTLMQGLLVAFCALFHAV